MPMKEGTGKIQFHLLRMDKIRVLRGKMPNFEV